MTRTSAQIANRVATTLTEWLSMINVHRSGLIPMPRFILLPRGVSQCSVMYLFLPGVVLVVLLRVVPLPVGHVRQLAVPL